MHRFRNLVLGNSLEFGTWDLGFPRRRALVALLILCSVFRASARTEVIPPKPAGYFNDYANVVSKEKALALNEKLAQFERDTSNQVVVAVFRKMESDSSIEDYTVRVAQKWGVGTKEHRNGVVTDPA